jgi:RNA polymerase sigma-70 factor (ECF subfamily)
MKTAETDRMEVGALDAVLRQARAGDDAAFAQLFQAYRRRVFGLCRYLLGSTDAAEDAASEVFLRAHKAMSSYDTALPFDRWLLSIASHLCIDNLRRRRVERRLFAPPEAEQPEPPGPSLSPLAELLGSERRRAVRAALGALPEQYRLPLTLRYYSELSYEQIAAVLGLSRNNVATLIFRGKKELRRRLAQPQEVIIQ